MIYKIMLDKRKIEETKGFMISKHIIDFLKWKNEKENKKMIKDNKVTITINGKEVELELTKEQIEKLTKKERKVWKPEIGDYYYYITMEGKTGKINNTNDFTDRGLYSMGNVFKTREEALFQVKKLKVIKELKDYIAENSEPVDWEEDSPKYFLTFLHNGQEIYIDYYYSTNQFQGVIYCSDEEVLEQAIKVIGEDRIKKYLFGLDITNIFGDEEYE